jgi:hypothetical protein
VTQSIGSKQVRGIYVLVLFWHSGYLASMPDEHSQLTPADPDDVRQTIAFALTFDGRKRFHHADELAMRITADHLARHLERCGFVVMKKPPGSGHSTSGKKLPSA